MPTRYAPRGKAKRVTVALVLPPQVVNYLRSVSKATGKSISSVAGEVMEAAIFGGDMPAQAEERKEA